MEAAQSPLAQCIVAALCVCVITILQNVIHFNDSTFLGRPIEYILSDRFQYNVLDRTMEWHSSFCLAVFIYRMKTLDSNISNDNDPL